MVKPEEMVVLDRYCAAQEDILKAYESYDFHEVQRLMRFCPSKWARSISTSSKIASTPAKADSVARQLPDRAVPYCSAGSLDGADHVLHRRRNLGYLPGSREKYVFTGEWYEGLFSPADDEAMNDDFWDDLLQVRGEVNKVIEQRVPTSWWAVLWKRRSRCMPMPIWPRS